MLTDQLLHIRDVSMRGDVLFELSLPLPTRAVALRELIAQRVRLQVQDQANGRTDATASLFQIGEAERMLNREGARSSAPADVERHVARALSGFEANRYVVIVDGAQVCSLDTRLPIGPETDVRFMRLVPLAGG